VTLLDDARRATCPKVTVTLAEIFLCKPITENNIQAGGLYIVDIIAEYILKKKKTLKR